MRLVLLAPLAVLTLLAGLLPLGAALYASWHGVLAAMHDPALRATLQTAALAAAIAAPVAVTLGFTGALAIWRAPRGLRFLVACIAVLVVVAPAPGFDSLAFLAPPRPAQAMAFACAIARGAALAVLIIGAGLHRVPAGLQRAALLAGARPLQAWRHAVLAPLQAYVALALSAAALAALAEGPAGAILAPHLDLAEAWIAPAALLLAGGSIAALAAMFRPQAGTPR